MSKTYGYARVSTKKQSIDRQIKNIKDCCRDAIIIKEEYTGTTTDRQEWSKLMKIIKSGDTIIFDSVSRMSRDAADGYNIYEKLYQDGVNLIFLKEPHINTDTYKKALESNIKMTGTSVDHILKGINLYLMELAKEQIRLAFEQAEKEVQDLHLRTREGIETARLAGKQIGQKPGVKLTTKKSIEKKAEILKHSKDFNGSLNDVDCMQLTRLSRNTFYKYKKELKKQEGHN